MHPEAGRQVRGDAEVTRHSTSKAQQGWINGLFEASYKGIQAAADPAITEAANPYKRFEHRTMWLEGFRDARILLRTPGPDNRCSYCDAGPCLSKPDQAIGIYPMPLCCGGPRV